MGFSGMSVGSLLLIFLIVIVLFGTKRLRNIGEDIGAALKSFRKGMGEGEDTGTANTEKRESTPEKDQE